MRKGIPYEENLSAEQYKTKKDPRVFRKDEYPRRQECVEEKESEGKKEVKCLDGRNPYDDSS